MMATCCDIIDDFFKLEENNVAVTCAATNWMRIPKMNPEEITNISMADKLSQMAAKFEQYENALSEVKCDNAKMDVRIKAIESTKPKQQIEPKELKGWPTIKSTMATPSVKVPSAITASDMNNSERHGSVPTQRQPGNLANANRVESHNGTPNTDQPFMPYRPRNRRYSNRGRDQSFNNMTAVRDANNRNSDNEPRRSRSGIMGQSTTSGLGAGSLPVRDFFIRRVNKEETVETVRAHILRNGITARDIVLKSNPDSMFKSFMVSVDVVDAEKVYSPEMWPLGVYVRRWRTY